MGVYSRFKKNPDGLRQLVELLESTPMSRRQRMIDVGMQEDPAYTEQALQFVMNFKDIIDLPDLELAEVLAEAPARHIGLAIHGQTEEIVQRFLHKSQPRVAAEIREVLEIDSISGSQKGSAQMKLIETARKLERKGLVRTKRVTT